LNIGKLGKKNTLYPSKELLEAIGVKEEDLVVYHVEKGKLNVEPLINPFKYALKAKKWTKTSLKEIEKISTRLQTEIIGKD